MALELPSFIADGYDALNRRDFDGWLTGLREDVEVHETPEVPDASVYRGRAEARRWAESVLSLANEWRWTPEEVLVNDGDTVVVRVNFAIESRAGVPGDMTVFHVFEVSDGQVATVLGFLGREQALEAARKPE